MGRLIVVLFSKRVKDCRGKNVTGPCCQLGTYHSRWVWSRGQRAKEGISGVLEFAKFQAAIFSAKNEGI